MSEPNNSAWSFVEITGNDEFDINAIFGSGNSAAYQGKPFEAPAATVPTATLIPAPVAQETSLAPAAVPALATAALNTEKVKNILLAWVATFEKKGVKGRR